MQRFYVDFDKFSKGDRKQGSVDRRLDKKWEMPPPRLSFFLKVFSGKGEDQLFIAVWPQRPISWKITDKFKDIKDKWPKKL